MRRRTVVAAIFASAALTAACGTLLSIDEDESPRSSDAAAFESSVAEGAADTSALPADSGADRHLTVFVSNQVLSGGILVDSGMFASPVLGHDGGDFLCAQEAAEAALTGNYRAWLSESGRDIVASLPADADWSMPVGGGATALVFPSRAHITAGMPPLLPLDHTAKGQMVVATDRAWTGTTPFGTATTVDCTRWTIVAGGNATYGIVGQQTVAWTLGGADVDCSNPYHLYCFGY